MSSNSTQIGGDHYFRMKIQPWDFIVANNIPFLEGSAIKYICRHASKGGMEDLQKAKHFIEKLIEIAGIENEKKADQFMDDSFDSLYTNSWGGHKEEETVVDEIKKFEKPVEQQIKGFVEGETAYSQLLVRICKIMSWYRVGRREGWEVFTEEARELLKSKGITRDVLK